MQINPAILTAAVLALAVCPASDAQSDATVVPYGRFGPRVLGEPLQPRPSRFSNNFVYGPSGTFQGLRRDWVLPSIPTDVIVPATGDLRDIYRAMNARPPLAVRVVPAPLPVAPTTVVSPVPAAQPVIQPAPAGQMPVEQIPAPVATEPAGINTQELPMRRSAGAAMAPAATASEPEAATRPYGPQSLSPLQTPGGAYTTFRPDFSYAGPPSDEVGARLTSQLSRSPRLAALSPIQVSVRGQTAVLRGRVATAHDRMVAEQVVRMESGIWNVDNQLQIADQAATHPTAR